MKEILRNHLIADVLKLDVSQNYHTKLLNKNLA